MSLHGNIKLDSNRKFVFYGTILFALLNIIYSAYIVLNYPYIGLDVKRLPDENAYLVYGMHPNGWAVNSDINISDRIISINGAPPAEHLPVQMFGTIEKAHSFILDRQGDRMEYIVEKGYGNLQLGTQLLYPISVLLISVLLGLFVYSRYTGGREALYLLLFTVCLGCSYLSASGSARSDIFSKGMTFATLMLIPVFFAYFLDTYIRNKFNVSFIHKRLLKMLVFSNILAFSVFLLSLFIYAMQDIRTALISLSFILEVILIVFSLINLLIRQQDPSLRANLKILLTGIILAFFPFMFLNSIPMLFFGSGIVSGEFGAIFILILPLTIVYLLMAKQLFDIDFVINRVVYNFVVSMLFTLIIAVLMLFLIKDSFVSSDFITFTLILFLLLNVFLYLIKDVFHYNFRLSVLAGKNFYQYSLYRYIEMIKNETSRDKLFSKLSEEVRTVLSVNDVSVMEIPKQEALQDHHEGIPIGILRNLEVGDIHQNHKCFFVKVGSTSDFNYLLFSKSKPNSTKLNREEMEWLRALAYHTFVSFENLWQIDELLTELRSPQNRIEEAPSYSFFSKLLFSISERERMNLSKDIHDTILQESIFINRRFDSLNESISKEELLAEVRCIQERILDGISMVREVCHELRPPLLIENGILFSIEELIGKVHLRTNMVVKFRHNLIDSLENDIDFSLNIYRIFQELLNNAVKHSRASLIEMDLNQVDETLVIEYRDNGVGFEPSEHLEGSGQLGLVSLKERAAGYGGTFKVESGKDKGVFIQFHFPIKKGERYDSYSYC